VISNEDLWERTKQKKIWKEIRYRKWIGNILRQDNENIAKKALEWNRKEEEEEEDPGLHDEAQ
jgi:hypothetical protein